MKKSGSIETSTAQNSKPTNTQVSSAALAGDGNEITAPMQGVILKINVNVGDKVTKGQELIILEAMKMENEIISAFDGTVSAIHVTNGRSVDSGSVLVTIK